MGKFSRTGGKGAFPNKSLKEDINYDKEILLI